MGLFSQKTSTVKTCKMIELTYGLSHCKWTSQFSSPPLGPVGNSLTLAKPRPSGPIQPLPL